MGANLAEKSLRTETGRSVRGPERGVRNGGGAFRPPAR